MPIFSSLRRRPRRYRLFPYTTLFRSGPGENRSLRSLSVHALRRVFPTPINGKACPPSPQHGDGGHAFPLIGDRKSTRLNSSHRCISYAVFCLKKKKRNIEITRTPKTT